MLKQADNINIIITFVEFHIIFIKFVQFHIIFIIFVEFHIILTAAKKLLFATSLFDWCTWWTIVAPCFYCINFMIDNFAM